MTDARKISKPKFNILRLPGELVIKRDNGPVLKMYANTVLTF